MSTPKVYDGRDNKLIKYYCDDVSPLFTTTNLLKLKFHNITGAETEQTLFDIIYLATDKGNTFIVHIECNICPSHEIGSFQ